MRRKCPPRRLEVEGGILSFGFCLQRVNAASQAGVLGGVMDWPVRRQGFLAPRYLRPDVIVVKLSGYRHSLDPVLRTIVKTVVEGKGVDMSDSAVATAVAFTSQLLQAPALAASAASEAFCDLLFFPVKSRASVLDELSNAVTAKAVSQWASEVRQSAAVFGTIRVSKSREEGSAL